MYFIQWTPGSVMIGLVLVMSLITIGKIQGQLTANPGAINVQILPPFPLEPTGSFIVPVQGRLISFSSQFLPLSNSVQRMDSRDRSQPNNKNDSDHNLRPLTLRENQPNRRFIIPQRTPEKASQPDRSNIESIKSIVAQDISTPDSNQSNMNPEHFETPPRQHEPSLKTNMTTENQDTPVTSEVVPNVSRVNETEDHMNGSTGKLPKPSIVDKATGVEVTLDERASFDGDKCPTGYVRINGMCVEKD